MLFFTTRNQTVQNIFPGMTILHTVMETMVGTLKTVINFLAKTINYIHFIYACLDLAGDRTHELP